MISPDHNNGWPFVAADLNLGECLLVCSGPLALQRPRAPALALVAEPQLVAGRLLHDPHTRLLLRLDRGLGLKL